MDAPWRFVWVRKLDFLFLCSYQIILAGTSNFCFVNYPPSSHIHWIILTTSFFTHFRWFVWLLKFFFLNLVQLCGISDVFVSNLNPIHFSCSLYSNNIFITAWALCSVVQLFTCRQWRYTRGYWAWSMLHPTRRTQVMSCLLQARHSRSANVLQNFITWWSYISSSICEYLILLLVFF